MVIPTDVVGYNYIVTSVVTIELSDSFIVIHGNNSHVELRLPEGLQSSISISGEQYDAGSNINISFPANGVLGIKCSCDLSGATIFSNLPVSVLVGNTKRNSTDGVIEQLPPMNTWGRKFLFSKSIWFAQNITLKITGKYN